MPSLESEQRPLPPEEKPKIVEQSFNKVEEQIVEPEPKKKKVAARVKKTAEIKTLELKAKIEQELRIKIEAELRPGIEAEIRAKLEREIESSKENSNLGNENKIRISIELNMETKQIVEAILFAADKPMTTKQVQGVYPEIERPALSEIQTAIDVIIEDYAPRPICLKQLASGYRFQVREGFSYWISRLFEEKPPRYSRALLETLSIIAYRQPVTRGDIEDIRGVSVSSNIIRTLLDREWVRIIAHKEVPGRPALYGTTREFLDYFNLPSLNNLPEIEEIDDLSFSLNTADKELETEQQQNIENKIEQETSEKQQAIDDPISQTRH